jgi:16S rRNA (cytidine1402-2'-O)-methyltransferase
MKKSNLLLARLGRGEDVAYVSDAGTPGVSDPGYVLVRNALSKGIPVAPVPGASALIAALSVSGLPMDQFVFIGFLPAKPIRRRQVLETLLQEERTLVFYESPRRLLATLRDMETVFGEREIVVAREMTKIFETFLRGPASRIIAALGSAVIRGELTLIVAGRSERKADFSDEELLALGRRMGDAGGKGLSLRDLADGIMEETGITRRRIYRLLLSDRSLRGS